MGWLPTMIEHRCSVGERGGFFVRLHRGTYMAHILEHVSLELKPLRERTLVTVALEKQKRKALIASRLNTPTSNLVWLASMLRFN